MGLRVLLSMVLAAAAGVAAGQGAGAAASAGAVDAVDAGVVARSARLSFVGTGAVTVSRGNNNERVAAQQNMALAQGDRVIAGEGGQAEVEFEDGSVARLTPNSSMSLDFLGMDSGGEGTVTILRVIRGLAYLELRASGAGKFRVMAGGDTFWPVENATVRVNLDDPPTVFSVLDGRIRVEHVAAGGGEAGGPQAIEGYRTDVRAGESLRDDATDASRYFLSEGIAAESWDHWNEQRDQAAADALGDGTEVRNGYAGSQGYGWGDLDASGTWYGADGQAPVWQPQEALAAGFDPYGYGSWTYFPGGGYTWASGYGWGWTPFRCGAWQFWDNFGWGWQPDGFCGGPWRYGGLGINVYRGPRGYRPIGTPIKRPGGVHPIVPGPHPGERPSFERGVRRDLAEREIAGVVVRPIHSAGFGVTPRGGSAVGSALRRDYTMDGRTHGATLGVVGAGSVVRQQPLSAPLGWRSVATRPEVAPSGGGGGLRGLFGGHGARGVEGASVRLDSRGNPYVQPTQREAGRSVPQGGVQQGVGQQRVQPGGAQQGYRPQPGGPGGLNRAPSPGYQGGQRSGPSLSAPAVHSAPAPSAPAMHSAPAPSSAPAASAGKR